MSFLFGKKQGIQSLAEVCEDGREIMNAEMKVGLLKAHLLKPGVHARVKYDHANVKMWNKLIIRNLFWNAILN